MSVTMHQASAAAFERGLTALANVLRKAATHAAEKKIEDSVFLDARLYPDMLPFRSQVHIASDFARGTLARLLAQDLPKWDDDEKSLAELVARVERTLEVVRAVKPASLEGSETREIMRKVGGKERTFSGVDYLIKFALPNFYFHAATAYDILRHNGVVLGKSDFLGSFD